MSESKFLIYFFDVPVYRIKPEKYSEQFNSYISEFMSGTPSRKEMYERHPDIATETISWLHRKFGGCWSYNEIIGYIQLHFLGSQIRGDYIGQEAIRLHRNGRKQFVHRTHKLAPEIDIPDGASSHEILQAIKQYLTDCKREIPRRYIDTERFDAIAPYIDWHKLYDRPY